MKQSPILQTVQTSVFTTLMIVGTYIRFPVGPVPIVLTNLFIVLAGYLLGPKRGCVAVGMYLFLGAVGLPVFSGGGGIALFLGPTAGYLIGYPLACIVTGTLARARHTSSILKDAVVLLSGFLIIYIPGALWLAYSTGLSADIAITAGIVPFIPGDILKTIIGASVIHGLRRSVPELFPVFDREA